ncbi:MAG: hypothetical protein FJY95_21965 [Candidatus Handelsmanbacteria bacterium]|nr:hypothetical protein [Candidatus Handelsmanbacteria bacterium]
MAAIETRASHWQPYSFRCSRTLWTARSRTSGEYLIGFVVTPFSQALEPPAIPVQPRLLTGQEENTMPPAEHSESGDDTDYEEFDDCFSVGDYGVFPIYFRREGKEYFYEPQEYDTVGPFATLEEARENARKEFQSTDGGFWDNEEDADAHQEQMSGSDDDED